MNFRKLVSSIFNSPASRGIIGVFVIYLVGLENIMEDFLWIPARIVIYIAIVVVGARLGIITKSKKILITFKENIKYSLFLKLFILPSFIYLFCKILNFDVTETIALVLQAGTPSAISTILLAEAYRNKIDLAAKAFFTTTIFSMVTIPLMFFLMSL